MIFYYNYKLIATLHAHPCALLSSVIRLYDQILALLVSKSDPALTTVHVGCRDKRWFSDRKQVNIFDRKQLITKSQEMRLPDESSPRCEMLCMLSLLRLSTLSRHIATHSSSSATLLACE